MGRRERERQKLGRSNRSELTVERPWLYGSWVKRERAPVAVACEGQDTEVILS